MSADYARLINAETWDFIRATEAEYPPDAADLSVPDQRAVYDKMCQAFAQPHPAGVAVRDDVVGEVPVRIYQAGSPTASVLYLHGGGFVVGGLDSHDDVCAEICATTGFRVVAVDYRLAPEHKFPAAFDDAWAVACWLSDASPDHRITLVGDSAGGNLAAAVAHHARDRLSRISGQVLIYPGLGGPRDSASYVTHAEAPMLTAKDIEFYRSVLFDGAEPLGDPTYAPLQDSDFTGLPPTVIITAECDPLSDDGGLYRDRIVAAGGHAHWVEEPGLVHGYLRARHSVTRARHSFDRITAAIEALGQGLWPYG